jgi:hypothetical protein
MTVRFRRSLALASGVRLNCGLRGIGVSVGGHACVGYYRRDGYASASPQLLAAGVSLPVVSQRLGQHRYATPWRPMNQPRPRSGKQ